MCVSVECSIQWAYECVFLQRGGWKRACEYVEYRMAVVWECVFLWSIEQELVCEIFFVECSDVSGHESVYFLRVQDGCLREQVCFYIVKYISGDLNVCFCRVQVDSEIQNFFSLQCSVQCACEGVFLYNALMVVGL